MVIAARHDARKVVPITLCFAELFRSAPSCQVGYYARLYANRRALFLRRSRAGTATTNTPTSPSGNSGTLRFSPQSVPTQTWLIWPALLPTVPFGDMNNGAVVHGPSKLEVKTASALYPLPESRVRLPVSFGDVTVKVPDDTSVNTTWMHMEPMPTTGAKGGPKRLLGSKPGGFPSVKVPPVHTVVVQLPLETLK